ncbi:gag-pol polyprotein, partial [Striga asiatica]
GALIEFKYENLLTFCFYCGKIGHNERQCESKREDLHRNVLRTWQFGEWLRGSYGGTSDPKERNSSTPPPAKITSDPSIAKTAEIVGSNPSEKREILASSSSLPITPIVNESKDKGKKPVVCSEGSGKESPHQVKVVDDSRPDNAVLVSDKMDLDSAKLPVLDSGNFINIPIQQDKSPPSCAKKPKTFTRLARNKPVSKEAQTSEPVISPMILKRKLPVSLTDSLIQSESLPKKADAVAEVTDYFQQLFTSEN